MMRLPFSTEVPSDAFWLLIEYPKEYTSDIWGTPTSCYCDDCRDCGVNYDLEHRISEFFDLHRSCVRLLQSLHLRDRLLRFNQPAKFVLVDLFIRQKLHPFF